MWDFHKEFYIIIRKKKAWTQYCQALVINTTDLLGCLLSFLLMVDTISVGDLFFVFLKLKLQ